MTFLTVWIVYAICGTTLFSAVFVWAVRTRQFSNLGRAGRMPLEGLDALEVTDTDRKPGIADRYTWVFLAIVTTLAIAAAFWLGIRSR